METSQRGRERKTPAPPPEIKDTANAPGAALARRATPDERDRDVAALETEATSAPAGPEPTLRSDVTSARIDPVDVEAGLLVNKDLESLSVGTTGPLTGALAPRTTFAPRWLPNLPALHIDERLGRILLSLVLAVLLWFYVVNLENPTNSTLLTGLTVDVRNAGSQLKVINSVPPVDATVQGPQNVLSKLVKSDIKPFIDLIGLGEGVHDVPVQMDIDPGKARELNVSLSRSKVQIQVELQISRVFTVTAQTNGTPAFGYRLEPAQVTPSQVRVMGLKDAVSRVSRVVVQADMEGKAGTQQGTKIPSALDANGQEIKDLTFEPANVEVVVPVKLLFNYKVVPVRVPLQGQPASGYQVSSINIDPTNVTVCCAPNLLDQIQVLEANPVAITGTTSPVLTSTKLILPPGVELYFDQPKQISVTVNVGPIETTLSLAVAPKVEGVPPGYGAVVSPSQLDLTLAGTYNQLQNLSPAAIQAVISADGRTAGTYTLKPQIVVPQGIRIISASPGEVTLTLSAPTPPPTQTSLPQSTATPTNEPASTPTPTVARPSREATATVQTTSTPLSTPTATRTPTPEPQLTVTATATP